jgi:hypothetical protein
MKKDTPKNQMGIEKYKNYSYTIGMISPNLGEIKFSSK